MLGLCCFVRAFSSCQAHGGLPFIVACEILTDVASLVAHTGSAVVHGLRRSEAGGIFPYQGSNLCPLHWQADS